MKMFFTLSLLLGNFKLKLGEMRRMPIDDKVVVYRIAKKFKSHNAIPT